MGAGQWKLKARPTCALPTATSPRWPSMACTAPIIPLAVAQGQAVPDRDLREVVAAYVRRLEALRRAGIVE
ncbi:hypothetical protein Busp01_56050 [Trinickia caryophylli]|uniref:Uncharacterized protein n=1 Tax=Trinickia caryophylli TaxID=28094 RepID=A0A1X7H9G7_TRICW|nr:hypothetical protein Busp01_56050 [Trinickia caryophylli]SMF81524.1 hypothetical protein SAMN06295900_12380 [Trinickia caryophylli]